jgi:hypothetical protein
MSRPPESEGIEAYDAELELVHHMEVHMKISRSWIVRGGSVLAASALILAASVAQARSLVPLDGQTLTGANASWDTRSNFDYGDENGAPCTATATAGFSPVEDGSYLTASDAFDGGLFLNVGGSIFDDADGNGRLAGQQLTAGPTEMSGLQVTRIERALSTSPTLRSLVRFKNPSAKAIKATVMWDSALGSDGSGATRTSSTAPLDSMTVADRWVISSDDPTAPSDAPVTFVLFGAGRPLVTPGRVVEAPEATPALDYDCVVVRYKVLVPAHTTRYLLFFTELHDPTNMTSAFNGARKFNKVKVGKPVMVGISNSVASKILNWDF